MSNASESRFDLERTIFSTSRAAEFLERRALETQTGQPAEKFGDVVIKELGDNGLDSAETAGVMPVIKIYQGHSEGAESANSYTWVEDNGPGMPPELIDRILDFDRLVSDKAAYRSPARGAQGNALKTVLGIPFALGVHEPVIIEACGLHHEVTVGLDPGGNVVVSHPEPTPCDQATGTRIGVPVAFEVEDDGMWARRFAAFNPQAMINEIEPSVDERWRKPLPTDRTSPWWYDEAALSKLVFAHIGASRDGNGDKPLGEFIREFSGLSSTAKAKAVASAVPGIEHLSDFEAESNQIGLLLRAMQACTSCPKPTVLGRIPEDHYRDRFDSSYGVERFWFKRKAMVDLRGGPWLVELALAETYDPGEVFYGVNYSPTFGDPLRRWQMPGHGDEPQIGARGLLTESGAFPDGEAGRACALHIVCPTLEFLDKGKGEPIVPRVIATEISTMFKTVTKALYKEHKRRQRGARVPRHVPSSSGITRKDACCTVLYEAAMHASGGGALKYGARGLYYQVRPRIQQYTADELGYKYFSQTIVPAYQREIGDLPPGLYYEARGHLYEPHTGVAVPLGTREMDAYVPTAWSYNKILYVEKEGLWPVLEQAQIAERFDMAVIAGKGFAVEACRSFLESVDPGEYRIFCLHDADWSGYNIAITLGEETQRMPGYSVKVTDLGLTIDQAISADLQTERVVRREALPWRVEGRLNATERQWFEGTPRTNPKHFDCTRVELNAFSSPDLISFIEARLEEEGATQKLVPPTEVIDARAAEHHEERAREKLEQAILDALDLDSLIDELMKATPIDQVPVEQVKDELVGNPPIWWHKAVADQVDEQLGEEITTKAETIARRAIDEWEGESR